jgi:ubiquinone/menaquinone biosynthesis C-methylase UbiE
MMQFYKQFSTYYDQIFKLKTAKVDFLVNNLEEEGRILDIAAGTGNYALEIAKRGHSVRGLDLSQAMIERAVDKVKDKRLKLEFEVGDMRDLTSIYKEEQFDLIYCIGNSLVHLENNREIKDVLNQIYSLLKPGDQLIIQIVNYDRILREEITSLPTINNKEENVKLIRNYELEDGKINFKTQLITPQGKFKNSVLLYPLQSDELKEIVTELGYAEVDLYGGVNDEDYKPVQSFSLLAVMTK